MHYKGHKKPIPGRRHRASARRGSALQDCIVAYLARLLRKSAGDDMFVYTKTQNDRSQAGAMLGDIVLYHREQQPAAGGAATPAALHINVDASEKYEEAGIGGNLKQKTSALLKRGTEKVMWVLMATRGILLAEPGKEWRWVDWNETVALWQGIDCCIGKHLQQEGFSG